MNRAAIELIDRTAAAQHGVLTSRQADRLLGASRKSHWIRSGRLLWVQPRVLRLSGTPSTWHQALIAAQLSARGVVSHRSAAQLWGLVGGPEQIEVSVGGGRHPQLAPPARAHRIKDIHPELAVRRQGLRITDPRRTLVDLGLVLPPRQISDALSRALTTKLVTLDDVRWLREALGRQGRNGTGIIGELLDRRRRTEGREESVLESRFVDLLTHLNIDLPSLQHEVWESGRFVARVDAAYVDIKLAIELDGYETRESPEALARELDRQNRLISLGWRVLRFPWSRVTRDGQTVVQEILANRRDLCRRTTT